MPATSRPERRFDLHDQPWYGLMYLLFAYLPLVFRPQDLALGLPTTLLATALFLPVYFAFYRRAAAASPWPYLLAVATLGYALIPFNAGGNTFVIYAMAMGAAALRPRVAALAGVGFALAMTVAFVSTIPVLRIALTLSAVMALVGLMAMAGLLYSRRRAREDASLRLTQDEVRRLAGMAERERIGRDLHDLLGHTLSVVALKSELAGKLVERDPPAAKAQMREVEQVARDALAQVREAVSGIRAAGLEAELASARLALLAAEVRLDARLAPLALDAATEQALALVLREAVTNVLRHAQAHRLEVELGEHTGMVQLSIADDGRGGIAGSNHGLAGMQERVAALGGTLEIDSPAGAGTRLLLRVPRATEGAA